MTALRFQTGGKTARKTDRHRCTYGGGGGMMCVCLTCRMQVYVHRCVCTCMHACMCACMYACVCGVWVCVCVHACMHVCMHVWLYTCVCVCVYIFVSRFITGLCSNERLGAMNWMPRSNRKFNLHSHRPTVVNNEAA